MYDVRTIEVTTSIVNYITGHKIFHQETELLDMCFS